MKGGEGTPRLLVLGRALATSIGATAEACWEAMGEGRTGLRKISRFPTGDYPVQAGGEVPARPSARGAHGSEEVDWLLTTARDALVDAGLAGGRFPRPERAGLVIGSSLAGSSTGEAFFSEYLAKGAARASYGRLEGYYTERIVEEVAVATGALGPSYLVSNACAAGASSIARAARLLLGGEAELVLAMGYDPLSIFTFAGFGSLQALSRTRVMPFGRDRDGMLLGDGYAAIVLAREGAAAALRVPRARLSGWGESADAHHLTHPHPRGAGAALAMRRALRRAELEPAEIDYVNCHGTATRPNDAAEAAALKEVFGERLPQLPISSSKPFFGHTLGGAGAVEAVVTILALEHQRLPPTLNAREPDPELGTLDLVPEGRGARLRHAMSNSFGFGGCNASLIFSAISDATAPTGETSS